MILEQELKLIVNSAEKLDLTRLSWPQACQQGQVETLHLISVYYDTPELDLSRQKVGLRLRKSNQQWLQTVKTSGTVSQGLHQREEWEHELVDTQWDLEKLRQTPLAKIIDDTDCWAKVAPLFTTDFIRETIQLTQEDGSQIELAYDRGHVSVDDEQVIIHEIELELKSGNVEQLSVVAALLNEQLDVQASDCSKAKQGYQLVAKNA